MSDHHDNHHSSEQKPVSFTVPLIMASVFILIMVLLLSVCDPRHGDKCECKEDCSKECMEKCEKGDHSSHDEHGNEIKGAAAHEEHATEHNDMAKDSTVADHATMPKDTASEHHGH
ncbi:MAG: hypothetical protein ACXVC7_13100 [Bacteroidia bacterium]